MFQARTDKRYDAEIVVNFAAQLLLVLVLLVAGIGPATAQNGAVSAIIVPGKVTFKNSCSYEITLYSTGKIFGRLEPNGTKSVKISDFDEGGPNLVIPYPNLPASRCPDCDGWTALGGVPGTTQRQGWMWLRNNTRFATYCNPNLSGRNICATQKNCCGPTMVQDGTFGSHWEFTPKGTRTNDFVNLSTNFGTGPYSPPQLCGPGVDPDNCVTKSANIFFNIPISWSSNLACSFTSQGRTVMGLNCLTADCPDAYQFPKDDKQASCLTNSLRGYMVEFCRPGSGSRGAHQRSQNPKAN